MSKSSKSSSMFVLKGSMSSTHGIPQSPSHDHLSETVSASAAKEPIDHQVSAGNLNTGLISQSSYTPNYDLRHVQRNEDVKSSDNYHQFNDLSASSSLITTDQDGTEFIEDSHHHSDYCLSYHDPEIPTYDQNLSIESDLNGHTSVINEAPRTDNAAVIQSSNIQLPHSQFSPTTERWTLQHLRDERIRLGLLGEHDDIQILEYDQDLIAEFTGCD